MFVHYVLVCTHTCVKVSLSRGAGDVCLQGSLIAGDRNKKCVLVLKMSPAVNMLTTVFLSALLMLGGVRGAAASDFQVYGQLIHSDKTLVSREDGRHTVRRQPHQQVRIIK